MSWSKQRLTELLGSGFGPAPVDPSLGTAGITKLKDCTGEVLFSLKSFPTHVLVETRLWDLVSGNLRQKTCSQLSHALDSMKQFQKARLDP